MSTTALDKSVLVVEDDGITRSALALALESAGYKVHQASDGREAFRALHTISPPSAILLDVVMPHMNGWEFLRERDANDPGLSDIPVIVFSAACEASPRMPLPRGVKKLLSKPVGCAEVLTALSEILETLEQ
jgi:chemotaxis family two-component system sensor histidine kinase/response regulator PixL